MTIGFVSSEIYVETIRRMVESEFNHIDVRFFTYKEYTQAPGLLEQHQDECDAVLFSGSLAYYHCRANFTQKVPWVVVKPQSSSLAMALKEAVDKGYDLKRMCVNASNENLVRSACNELGIEPEKVYAYNHSGDSGEFVDTDYNIRVYRFFRRQLEENGATCFVTANLWVYRRMSADGYPVVFMKTSLDSFRAAFHETYRRALGGVEGMAQIVAIIVGSDLPEDYSSSVQSEYMHMRRKLRTLERVYTFAAQIQGIVCDETGNRQMIITAREDFEAETSGFREFKLFRDLNSNTLENYFVGVGYGITAVGARKNARVALEQAKNNGSNSACLVAADGSVVSLISYLNESDEGEGGNKIDRLAARTGLSPALLQRFIKAIESSGKNDFTSAELASLLGVSKRNMDRMLLRIESAGLATMIGKVVDGERGRPKRVFELNFDFK